MTDSSSTFTTERGASATIAHPVLAVLAGYKTEEDGWPLRLVDAHRCNIVERALNTAAFNELREEVHSATPTEAMKIAFQSAVAFMNLVIGMDRSSFSAQMKWAAGKVPEMLTRNQCKNKPAVKRGIDISIKAINHILDDLAATAF